MLLLVEALKVLEKEKNNIDLVLTDIDMPIMDGGELITSITSHNSFKDIPVIVLSSREDEKTQEQMLLKGAKKCLVKFDEDEILETLNQVLSV